MIISKKQASKLVEQATLLDEQNNGRPRYLNVRVKVEHVHAPAPLRLAVHSKLPGRHMGLLGPSALKLYKYLVFGFIGRECKPSRKFLAKRLNMAYSTVCDAFKRLRHAGLLDWQQCRCFYNGRWVQHANRYVFLKVKAAAHLIEPLKRVRKQVRDKVEATRKAAAAACSHR